MLSGDVPGGAAALRIDGALGGCVGCSSWSMLDCVQLQQGRAPAKVPPLCENYIGGKGGSCAGHVARCRTDALLMRSQGVFEGVRPCYGVQYCVEVPCQQALRPALCQACGRRAALLPPPLLQPVVPSSSCWIAAAFANRGSADARQGLQYQSELFLHERFVWGSMTIVALGSLATVGAVACGYGGMMLLKVW